MKDLLLSDLDARLVSAQNWLESYFEALAGPIPPVEAGRAAEAAAAASGGAILFDIFADHDASNDLRWIAIRYEEDGETRILHLFLSVDDTSYWVGPEEEIPEDFAQLTTSFKDLLHATPRSLGVRSTSPSHLS